MGLLPFSKTLFGIMPIFGNNVWFNGLTGLVAAYYAFIWHKENFDITEPQS